LFVERRNFFGHAKRRLLFGGDREQNDSARNDEWVAMFGAVRDRIPRVEQFAAFGKLHDESIESVDFELYAGILLEQQISATSAPRRGRPRRETHARSHFVQSPLI
jgi:hypothetical protein